MCIFRATLIQPMINLCSCPDTKKARLCETHLCKKRNTFKVHFNIITMRFLWFNTDRESLWKYLPYDSWPFGTPQNMTYRNTYWNVSRRTSKYNLKILSGDSSSDSSNIIGNFLVWLEVFEASMFGWLWPPLLDKSCRFWDF